MIIGCWVCMYNESNIIEWMNYHLNKIGIDHIYIYDDYSDIPIKNILENSNISKTNYTIFPKFEAIGKFMNGINLENMMPCELSCGNNNYMYQCILPYIDKMDYLLRIDIDEYLYLGSYTNIKDLVKYYQPFDQLIFNWKEFGWNNILKNTTNQLIHTFTKSWTNVSICGKAIAKVNRIIGIDSPHYFLLKNDDRDFINKDIFNVCYKFGRNMTCSDEYITLFNKNKIENKNFQYLAHYRIQDLYNFINKRLINYPYSWITGKNPKQYLHHFGYSKVGIKLALERKSWSFNNPNKDEAFNYISNQRFKNNFDTRLYYNKDKTQVCKETLEHLSHFWWSIVKDHEQDIDNFDLLNYINLGFYNVLDKESFYKYDKIGLVNMLEWDIK